MIIVPTVHENLESYCIWNKNHMDTFDRYQIPLIEIKRAFKIYNFCSMQYQVNYFYDEKFLTLIEFNDDVCRNTIFNALELLKENHIQFLYVSMRFHHM